MDQPVRRSTESTSQVQQLINQPDAAMHQPAICSNESTSQMLQ
jgi:hypothetical protein